MASARALLPFLAIFGCAGVLFVGMGATFAGVYYYVEVLHPPAPSVPSMPVEPIEDAEPEEEPASAPAPSEPTAAPAPTPAPEPAAPPADDAAGDTEEVTVAEEAEEKAPTGCTPNSRGIRQLGPTRWEVKRSVIERYTKNPSKADELAAVKWATDKKGNHTGVRLLRVPCKSPLRAAGLLSKDLILTVDGREVTSMAQGLRVWAGIRRNDGFTVRIKRGGQVVSHRYVLVE